MFNTKECRICKATKSLNEFDCYKDGLYRLFCIDCRRKKDRVAAEKRRRAKGIQQVKDTAGICERCNESYVRSVVHNKFCQVCRDIVVLERARKASLAKARQRGNRIMGSEQKCEHCSATFVLDRPKAKYCKPCRALQKKRALPFMKEHVKKYTKEYMSKPENKRRTLDKANDLKRHKVATDPLFALIGRCRARVNQSFRKNGYTKRSKTHEIIGCSWEFLRGFIERQFKPGMTWENRSEWHIDHIIPLASAKTEEDVIKLNHYTNLRPLWAEENLKKSDKIESLV